MLTNFHVRPREPDSHAIEFSAACRALAPWLEAFQVRRAVPAATADQRVARPVARRAGWYRPTAKARSADSSSDRPQLIGSRYSERYLVRRA